MSHNSSTSGRYEWKSGGKDPLIAVYHYMDNFIHDTRRCHCDTPLAATRPIISKSQQVVTCISWCPFCGTSRYVAATFADFINITAPDDVWMLDADKIYEFVTSLNDSKYLPRHARSNDLAWTFPQTYHDGTFSINVFDIAIGRGLTVRAPECYILRDDKLSEFDTKILKEFNQLGSLGLIFPKEPAHANV